MAAFLGVAPALPDEAAIPGLALLPHLDPRPIAFGLHTFEQEPPEIDAGCHLVRTASTTYCGLAGATKG